MGRSLRTFRFKPSGVPVLVRETAEVILGHVENGKTSAEVSLDLGISQSVVTFRDDSVEFPNGDRVELEKLKIRGRGVYAVREGELKKVALFSGGKFYQLVSVGPRDAPTLEINGIHMHRVKSITPWEDSIEKARAARIFRGAEVLDVGTGLGYTAVLSVRFGASTVLTVEKDKNVLRIAEANPWSKELANERISVVLADATEAVEELEDSSYDRVIHDPPRLALAGELYSLEFYHQLFRVLRAGGRLFHYIGEPGKKRGKDILGGVSGRLKRAGFIALTRKAKGIVAEKPR